MLSFQESNERSVNEQRIASSRAERNQRSYEETGKLMMPNHSFTKHSIFGGSVSLHRERLLTFPIRN